MKKKACQPHPLHVRLLWLEEALHGSLLSSIDALRTMATVWNLHYPKQPSPLSWEIVDARGRAITLPGVPRIERSDEMHQQVLLIVPALHVHNSPEMDRIAQANMPVLRLIDDHMKSGGWMTVAQCGIIFPAMLGLLDGAKVSVPWAHHAWFSRIYPGVDFSDVAPITTHDRMFLCAAAASQMELILTALGQLVDPDLAEASAKLLSFRHDRQCLIEEVTRSKSTSATPDSPVYRAIQWLNAHLEEPYHLPALAAAAATSKRTLLRHFHDVTGVSPLEYLHRLRVERAKVLLEVTIQSVEAISRACGYANVSSFRRLFQNATGITPNAYRTRFSLRAPRTHWKVEDQQ